MPILQFLSGAVLLTAGKKIYWFLFAVLAFLVSTAVLPVILPYLAQKTIYIAGAIMSAIIVVLVFITKKIAIGLGGFIGGGFLFLQILRYLNISSLADLPEPVIFAVGGVVGVLLSVVLFELTIVLLSIFTGSFLIMDLFSINPLMRFVFLLFLCLLGTYLQIKWKTKNESDLL